jgi:ketosteroid isomerase-like protein
MTTHDEIQQASDEFYAALGRLIQGDPEPIMATVSHTEEVAMMHPLGGRQVGWEAVSQSLRGIAQAITDARVTVTDLIVVPVTDDVGYTLGTEHGEGTIGDQPIRFSARTTNIYRREPGGWKLVHHHSDADPGAVEALERVLGAVAAR